MEMVKSCRFQFQTRLTVLSESANAAGTKVLTLSNGFVKSVIVKNHRRFKRRMSWYQNTTDLFDCYCFLQAPSPSTCFKGGCKGYL